MSAVDSLLADLPIPEMIKVRQTFPAVTIEDPAVTLRESLAAAGVGDTVKEDDRIAITAGSRGISGLPRMLATVVQFLTEHGAKPFIVPAMGSHGGATAQGQVDLLAHMGITEASVGAPIVSDMSVTRFGVTAAGVPIYMDRKAAEADGIVVVNRIKPHVGFRGPCESGIMKMMAIGLGKQKGAEACHDLGFGMMAENIQVLGKAVIDTGKIRFAVGIIENAYHGTARLEVLRPEEIADTEPGLQELAKETSARLYFDELDVLIIDEIGKDISGTGFDNNVVGRFHTPYASGGPDITRIATLDITDRSHGNGNGLGILDFTTRRAFEKFDFAQTYPNSLTSTVPTSVKIPMVLANDRQAIQAAIKTCNILDKTEVRLVRIKNTLTLGEIEVSVSLLPEIEKHPELSPVGGPYPLVFDEDGNLF